MSQSRVANHPTRDDIDLVSGAFWGRNPHDEMAWMRANAPVYWDGRAWGITRYEDLKRVSTDPATFSNAGGIRPDSGPIAMMIDMDDPEHLRRRKLVNRGYTPRRVRDREQEVRDACDAIIDAALTKATCDFVWDIAAPLPLAMIANDLGVDEADRPQLLEWSDAMLRALTGDESMIDKAAEAFAGYMTFAADVITDRKATPRDDLMSVLCHAEVEGEKLSDDEIIHESLLILIGGDETTRHVISGGAFQLLSDRAQWDALRANPALIPTAVEEMLRWVSPIKNMNRTAARDVEFAGQTIAAGDNVMLLYPSANRDESVFDEPFRFDVTRTPNEHVAFGFGTHFCLGNSLARLELRVMFEQLLERVPDLAPASADEPPYRPANFISGYETLPVSLGAKR
ncbi:MAG: cholest-4-en-3-one 26-monooxygenase [Actinomycetota bacterium]